jgi:hypothetical protein
MENNPEQPSLGLLVKLGSIAVHVQEVMSPQRHSYDVVAIKALVDDPEVTAWIKAMGPLLPVKRS